MELLRITRQIHCKVVEQRATLNTDNTSGQWSLRWRKWTPAAVCDMPSCPAVLATLRLSRKPKHQLPQQLPVSACLLFQFLIKMRCSLYSYAVRCPPPTVENGEIHTSLLPCYKILAAPLDSRHLQADCQEPGSAPEPYARSSRMG